MTKIKILIQIMIVLRVFQLNASFWTVNQDSTGDFTSIQMAINNANDGDSILVYPGRYPETVNYLGKSISLLSLAITTGNEEYVQQTIIDANENGTTVSIRGCNDAYLGGFTITGGSGSIVNVFHTYAAGGLLVMDSKAYIDRCLITGNNAQAAGGVFLNHSRVFLSGNTITENTASDGGGLNIAYGSSDNYYVFDPVNKNNIYINSAAKGQELYISGAPYLEIPLGKANVMHKDPYFYYFTPSCGEVNVYADSAVINQVESDLYVATWGSDLNSGLTPDEPLKRISYALMKIKADSLNHQTIYIEEGTYSHSETGELLPLQFKPYVTLTSLSDETRWTVDAEGRTELGKSMTNSGDITIRNAIFKRGMIQFVMFDIRTKGHNAFLKNIDVIESIHSSLVPSGSRVFGTMELKDLVIRNFRISGNSNGGGMVIAYRHPFRQTGVIDRVQIERTAGIGISLNYQPHYSNEGEIDVVISNSIIHNNVFTPVSFYLASALSVVGTNRYIPVDSHRVRIINCTITDNTYISGDDTDAAVWFERTLTAEMYNNIVYGNATNRIMLDGLDGYLKAHFSHNLFENGIRDIHVVGHNTFWTYDNIISGDPLFVLDGDHPYSLSQGSPAINAGTTDIEGYTFEQYDFAGNPRIFDGKIDLGAYEYQFLNAEEVVLDNNLRDQIISKAYPNPLSLSRNRGNNHCTISFSMPSEADIVVAIHNIKGQRVRTLTTGLLGEGKHEIFWDGNNDRGVQVGTGMYLYRIETADMESSGSIFIVK